MTMIRVGLVLVLALAAAVAANIVLLGVAAGPKDPVGRLSPRAGMVQLPAGSATAPSTSTSSSTSTSTTDDGGGRRADGHGRETPDD